MVFEISDDPDPAVDEQQNARLPLICSGFMMVRFTVRPSSVMVCVLVVTPDMSTGVCDWSPVRTSWGFGCGSSQNGLLSLLILARNDRT